MAAGRARSRSFITRGLAEGYRAELIRAARKGLDFSPGTGEPASWAAPEAATISWLEHAAAYAAMKWPLAAAHTRAGIADALATIAPALLTPGRGRPPAAVLRAALYGHTFNPARAGANPGPAATAALTWASHHCLPLTALADLCVPKISPTLCDEVIFVDQTTDTSLFSDAVLVEINWLGQGFQRRGCVQSAMGAVLIVVGLVLAQDPP
jgi:hypothetical protein